MNVWMNVKISCVHRFYFAHAKIPMCDACITISLLEVLHNCHIYNKCTHDSLYNTSHVPALSVFSISNFFLILVDDLLPPEPQ